MAVSSKVVFYTFPAAFEKYPSEQFNIGIDYTLYIPDTATIDHANVTIKEKATGNDVTNDLSEAGTAVVLDGGKQIKVWLTPGGVDGRTYQIIASATLDTEEIFVLVIDMAVLDEKLNEPWVEL